jgi:cob(I)alamin adenosyltransferase
MARIYTRTGDGGQTSLGDGARVGKDDARVDLYGDVDELNCAVGMAAALLEVQDDPPGQLISHLAHLQDTLFDVGAVLADPARAAGEHDFGAADLEARIDELTGVLPPLRAFILPGGTPAAAALHQARAVCRRAERKAVALARTETVPAGALVWLNRLSDYLFTAARAANALAGRQDVTWRGME